MDKVPKLPSWKSCSYQVLTTGLNHSVFSERVVYATYLTEPGGTSSPELSNVLSKNLRCPLPSSMALGSVIAFLQSCQGGAFLESAVLTFFRPAWEEMIDKVAVMVHLDLKPMSFYSSLGWLSGRFFPSPCCMPCWAGLKPGLCILRT